MLWTLLIAMTNSPLKNIWDEFTKMGKTGSSMESCWFSSKFSKIIKSFVLSS